MKSRDFCYWLQGYLELSDARGITTEQTAILKKHLAMVFKYEIDPSYGKEAQATLNEGHNPLSHLGGPPGPNGELIRC